MLFTFTDLKPDNIGFSVDGTLKLFDLGLCTLVMKPDHATDTYEMTGETGSMRYMAPEVVLSQPYNEKVDVYSFSIMLWQMTTDVVPFRELKRADFVDKVVHGGLRPAIDPSWPEEFQK